MTLQPIARASLSDAVFEQLSAEIVKGRFAPGHPLPPERTLCDLMKVNRGAIREAVKRLAQAGLVATQHGSGHQVLDYRRSAGLDLLPHLLVRADGDMDLGVVRSVMELRSAMAPDVARLCAERGSRQAELLKALVERMRAADGDLTVLQGLGLEFWDSLVEGSDNIAYRLAFNSMRAIYGPAREAMAEVLAEELTDVEGCARLAEAVAQADGESAAMAASSILGKGLRATLEAISALDGIAAWSGTEPKTTP